MIIRKLSPTDKDGWIRLFRSLSAKTINTRYFCHVNNSDLSVAESYWNSVIKYSKSIVAEIDGNIIGSAELYIDDNTAEFGIIVADEHQHAGIGTALFVGIESMLHKYGIIALISCVMPENHTMIRMMKKRKFVLQNDTWIKEYL